MAIVIYLDQNTQVLGACCARCLSLLTQIHADPVQVAHLTIDFLPVYRPSSIQPDIKQRVGCLKFCRNSVTMSATNLGLKKAD